MNFREPAVLGRTGLESGRLGVSGGYGAPAEAFEEAFEQGCNYFYHGSQRRSGMQRAIRNIVSQGKRDRLILLCQSYSRSARLMEWFLLKALRDLHVEYIDILLLGWYNRSPSGRVLEKARRMKEKGLYRFLAVSGHNRKAFPEFARQGFDVCHIRYNAAHRGAETEAFPQLTGSDRPGVVTYTATRWGQLLRSGRMPAGEPPLKSSDCYRFALTHPAVDVCLTGPRNRKQMREALDTLDLGPLSSREMERIRRIGDHLRGWNRK